MSTEHTTTPWELVEGEDSHGHPYWHIYNGDFVITDCKGQYGNFELNVEQVANAAFIVRAANAHDDLVAAAVRAIKAIDNSNADSGASFALRAALAKAEVRP